MKRYIPPLNALRAFEAAARTGSFRDAADELNVSHSAISHQIKRLEESLEIELFIRHPRSVELSKEGRKYYPVIRDAFDKIAEGTKVLLKPLQGNVLTIQTYSTFSIRWLVERLPGFSKENPDIQVRLNTSQSDVNFDHDDIDLAIMIGRPDRDDLSYDYLFSPEVFPVCAPALLEGEIPLSVPEDLERHTILQVYPSARDWSVWLGKYNVQSVDVSAAINLDSYDHALKMAARGIGVALGMQPYVREDLENGLLVAAFGDMTVAAPGNWYSVSPQERRTTKKVRLFREWLIRQVMADPDLSSRRHDNMA